jgi:hypothetical protein
MDGRIVVNDDKLMDVWRVHCEKLANEEFPWDKDALTWADATAGPCEKITMYGVQAAIKKMKNNGSWSISSSRRHVEGGWRCRRNMGYRYM